MGSRGLLTLDMEPLSLDHSILLNLNPDSSILANLNLDHNILANLNPDHSIQDNLDLDRNILDLFNILDLKILQQLTGFNPI
jgi:hypothetical protein